MIKRPAPVLSLAAVLAVTPLLCSVLFLAPSSAAAQQPAGTGALKTRGAKMPPATPVSTASQPSLSPFTWLAGHWQGEWGPRAAQQVWMAPQSGVMVGAFQESEDGKTLVVEFYTIALTPGGIELRVRHFTPALTPWEKSGPTVLILKSVDAKRILFESVDHGRRSRWSLSRSAPDTFVERFEIVPKEGEQQVAEITFHRYTSAPPSKR
ncbi:MAG: hypothetical protein KGL02_05895 [Acidobacteriota bacterium]|nr:hypothetical protein [Acidobacteriota bacterium]MDE3170558.1 hypothetical protein [Acidobacteriota bacterium]